MEIVNVCEALNISYSEYLSLPNWFIDLRLGKLNVEVKYKKDRQSKGKLNA